MLLICADEKNFNTKIILYQLQYPAFILFWRVLTWMTEGENAAIALVSFRIETILIDILFHIYFTFSGLFYVVWYFCIFYTVIIPETCVGSRNSNSSGNKNKSSHRKCSMKKLFLKILQYSWENIYVRFYFLIRLQAFRIATLLKRDSNTGEFL